MLTVLVALAAGVGAVARYVADQVVSHRTRGPLPYGTFVVNVTGSFVLGVVTGLALHHGLAPSVAVVLGVGLMGGYTTLSTWAWESLALTIDDAGALRHAAVNVFGSLIAGLAAAGAGLAVALL